LLGCGRLQMEREESLWGDRQNQIDKYELLRVQLIYF
jgi:hypothetical protein